MRGEARLISSAIRSWVKIGPWMKRKERFPALVLIHDFRAEDIGGHQVRCELHARGIQPEHRAERGDELGLGQPWHTDEKRMAAGEHGEQGLLHHGFLAEDDLGDFLADRGDIGECAFGSGHHGGFVHHRFAAGDCRHTAFSSRSRSFKFESNRNGVLIVSL